MRDRDRTIFRSLATGLALTLALGTVAAPAVANDGDDLVERADTTYRLLPDEGVIQVDSALTLTNKSKPVTRTGPCKNGKGTCKIKTRYYFTGWNAFWTPPNALDVTVGGPKVKAQPAQEFGEGLAYAITYPKLWNKKGAKQKASISFDVPSGTAMSADDPTRIEDGYAHFCYWGMAGDTGTTKAILPPGWAPVGTNPEVAIERTAGGVVLRAKSKQEPSGFIHCLEAVNPGRLDKTYLTGEDGKSLVVVEAWPDDVAWASDTAELVAEALPNLEAMLGTPMPADELRVREVATQSRSFTYGDMLPMDGVLGMGEDADPREYLGSRLARLWIDAEQITDPWLAEGLAIWLATQAIAGTVCAGPVAHPGPDAPDLDAWVEPTSDEVLSLANWQQSTACNLIATGAEVIGDEAMVALARELIEAPVPVGTSHWLSGVSRDLPEGLDAVVAALDVAGVEH